MNADDELLQSIASKLQIVRDRVRGVALGYATGFYLYGEGGIGKSWAVLDELQLLNTDYRIHNTRMTAKGLFLELSEYPDHVHCLGRYGATVPGQDRR
jgi:hypothetical protein